MPTEAIIVAALGIIGSVIGAIVASRAQARTTATGLYVELCKAQQERIGQLVQQIRSNEAEVERLRGVVTSATARITELESRNTQLQVDLTVAQGRIASLESENDSLRQTLTAMQKKPTTPRVKV
jgi:chromosome segregation ATPase